MPAIVQCQQEETLHNWMINLVRQEEQEEKVVMLSRRCMLRFLQCLDSDTVDMWRRSVLLAATCLLVTSKIVSQRPLGAKILIKYAGGAFKMEELMVGIISLNFKIISDDSDLADQECCVAFV